MLLFFCFLLGSLAVHVPHSFLAGANSLRSLWEINANLADYYLVMHGVGIAVLMCLRALSGKRRLVLSLLLLVVALPKLLDIAPFFGAPFYGAPFFGPRTNLPAKAVGTPLRVFVANVNTHSGDPAALASIIKRANPDILLLTEISDRWVNELALGTTYPHKIEIPRNNNFGMALYSRVGISRLVQTELGPNLPEIISAILETDSGFRFQFIGVHTLPPSSIGGIERSQQVLTEIIKQNKGSDIPLLIGGDFNASPHSSLYKNFVAELGLTNVQHGFGYHRSWNALSPYMRFTIDHLLYRGDIHVASYRTLEPFRSDHFPFIVELNIGSNTIE